MVKKFVCIICPVGCDLTAVTGEKDQISVEGNRCSKGKEYAKRELISPVRTIATSVLVKGGELPLVSVRVNRAIPKDLIFRVMKEAKEVVLTAPVDIGQVVLENVAGSGADLIVTKRVNVLSEFRQSGEN